jgi:hypothetical protein
MEDNHIMLTRITTLITAIVLIAALAACGPTTPTGTDTDAGAAGNYLPTVDGYTVTEADSISEAISAAAGTGADALNNELVSQVVERVDTFVTCYSEVGAVAANVYTKLDLADLLANGFAPSVGAVAVVNQDRLRENLVACASQGFAAMSADGPTICQSSGNFTANEDTFTYIYIASDQAFCDTVQTHFDGQ